MDAGGVLLARRAFDAGGDVDARRARRLQARRRRSPDRGRRTGTRVSADENPSQHRPVEGDAVAAGTRGVARRLGVEQEAVRPGSSGSAARSSREATPIAFITGMPVSARIAFTRSGVSLPWSCRRSGRSVSAMPRKSASSPSTVTATIFALPRARAASAAARSSDTFRGLGGKSMNPTKSAPASSAASTPSSPESPQILTSVGMRFPCHETPEKSNPRLARRLESGLATGRWNFRGRRLLLAGPSDETIEAVEETNSRRSRREAETLFVRERHQRISGDVS